MIDNLRQMERLDDNTERSIERKTRTAIIIAAIVTIVFIIWAAFKRQNDSPLYAAIIIIFLCLYWVLQDVGPMWWKRALAGRSDEQVQAYLKAMGFDLLANVGLGWFLVTISGNSFAGALIYMFGVMGARKQREIYYGNKDDETGDSEDGEPVLSADAPLPTAADRSLRAEDASGPDVSADEALPTAADRSLRAEDASETEDGDGSV